MSEKEISVYCPAWAMGRCVANQLQDCVISSFNGFILFIDVTFGANFAVNEISISCIRAVDR